MSTVALLRKKMTLQIGLICDDGMLLAGDTRVVGEDGLWTSSQSKFHYDDEMNVVVAQAGFSVSRRVAEAFLKADWNGDRSKGQQVAEEVYKKEFGNVINEEPIAKQYPTSLIVARRNDRRMFRFVIRTSTEVDEVKDKIISGDGSNSGVFVLERYYQPSLSMSKAAGIAALAIWFTGKLNPYVGGLEMIKFPHGEKPHLLTSSEIQTILDWCRDADTKMQELSTSMAGLISPCSP